MTRTEVRQEVYRVRADESLTPEERKSKLEGLRPEWNAAHDHDQPADVEPVAFHEAHG